MCTICLNISSLKLGLYIFMRWPERQWRYFKRYWLNRPVLNHSKPQRYANSMYVPSHVLYKNTTTSIWGRTVQNDTEFSVITFKTSRWQRQRQTRLGVFILVGVMCINSGRMTTASTVSRRRYICDVISFVVQYYFPRKHFPTKMKCSHMIIITYIIKAHYNDVIMGVIAPQITNLTIVYSAVYSGTDQRNHQSSAPLAFVWGIHLWPVNSTHMGPVTRKIFPFDDVIMNGDKTRLKSILIHWWQEALTKTTIDH